MTLQTFCPVCGATLAAGAQFCGNCGTRLSPTGSEGTAAGVGDEYAGFWQRFLATLIDGIIVLFVAGIPALIILLLASVALGYLVYFVIYVVYFAWGNGTGGTWGKQAMGIRVVSLETGGDIGFGRGVGRTVVSWLGSIPLYLGWFWMLWDDKKQTWHDKAVGSIVVKAQS